MKKEDRVQLNKEMIKKTAQTLFRERGFAATTMDDIARQGDYSKSTLYVYFKSKDEIFYSIVLDYMILLNEELKRCVDFDSRFISNYHAICNTLVSFEEKYPLYFEALLGEIAVTDVEKEKLPVLQEIYNAGEEINDLLEQIIKSSCAKKEIRCEVSVEQTVFTLWASIGGIISMSRKKEEYLKEKMNLNRTTYLNEAFTFLYRTISREE